MADGAADEARADAIEELGTDTQRIFARVYLDLKNGDRGALFRLERVLDDVAPGWRSLV
jgi:hypothetical protein